MSAQILNGKEIANSMLKTLAAKITQRNQAGHRPPGLAVILVGDDDASSIYVRNKRKACHQVGIISKFCHFPDTIIKQELIEVIHGLNNDPTIDGILVQLPLPAHIPADIIVEHISPDKDVDGFHPFNFGRLAQKRPFLRPCTSAGVMILLEHTGIDLRGKHATIVGVSNIVGRPILLELLIAGVTTTACHRATVDLQQQVANADILVVATGNPNLIKGNWIKPGSIVIDVGINRLADGSLTGDVEFSVAKDRASWITPVPGGVGPMTIAALMQNTLYANEKYHHT